MTFEVEVNGRQRTVAVERAGGDRLRVTIDGRARIVDVARLAAGGLSLVPDGGGPSRDVTLASGRGPGETIVRVRGRTVAVVVNGRRSRRHVVQAAAERAGPQRIVAPMSGRVVRLLAAPGDEVKARQPLVVVEAMKMENELASPKTGRVREVSVAEGMSVEAGRVLVVIE
jgi:biotin carboxyl carrier protein